MVTIELKSKTVLANKYKAIFTKEKLTKKDIKTANSLLERWLKIKG